MPRTEPSVKPKPVPLGEHLFTLTEVTANEYPDYNDPKKMTIRWRWIFRSDKVNPETGEYWELYVFTGPKYGAPNAALTILYNMIVPHLSQYQKERLDTDDLLMNRYRGMVRHDAPERPEDPPKARLAFIQPVDGEAASATPEDVPDLDATDPFADQ